MLEVPVTKQLFTDCNNTFSTAEGGRIFIRLLQDMGIFSLIDGEGEEVTRHNYGIQLLIYRGVLQVDRHGNIKNAGDLLKHILTARFNPNEIGDGL